MKKNSPSAGQNAPLKFIAIHSKFEAAREALIAFRTQNAKLVETHELLITAHNEALKETKVAYKDNHRDIGPQYAEFTVRISREIDAEKLLKLVPNAIDIVRIKYSVEREEYDKAVKSGLIPSEVVSQVESEGKLAIYGPKEQ